MSRHAQSRVAARNGVGVSTVLSSGLASRAQAGPVYSSRERGDCQWLRLRCKQLDVSIL